MKASTVIDVSIYNQIGILPQELKQEVLHFAEFLTLKVKDMPKIKEREFGCAKNAFIMADDFDEPLEDFKEYM